jgi:hypothetical protein
MASGAHSAIADSRSKPFAWSGIRLRVPWNWDTRQLARDYGLLEMDRRPVLEFKTAQLKRRCAPARLLKLLQQQLPRHRRRQLRAATTPAGWQRMLAGYETLAFTWQETKLLGRGLTIYCPTCRRATLLQFFEHADHPPIPVATILASLREHDPDPSPNLSVYDIRATLPPDLKLQHFTFASGFFELRYGHRRARATLWRWSPADIALSHNGGELGQFAVRNQLLPSRPPPASRIGTYICEWRWPVPTTRFWRHPFGVRPALRAVRLWHLPEANRLLAVRTEGQVAAQTFEAICESYNVL